jgi:hypothetical protein
MAKGKRFRRMLRVAGAAVAATLVAVALPSAQSNSEPLFEPAVVARVDGTYPGFAEVVDTCEPTSLERLSRVLADTPSSASLAVLLGVLEHCPAWSAPDGQGHPALTRLGGLARAAGELPVAPVARVLRNGNVDQRTTAALLLSANADLVSRREEGALEQALIDALSDPDLNIRVFVVGRLRHIGTAAGQAAIARALLDPNVTGTFRYHATGVAKTDALLAPGRLAQFGADELLTSLTASDADVRVAVVQQIARLMGDAASQRIAAADQDRIVTAMIGGLRDPSMSVRMAALSVLSRTRASGVLDAVIASVNERDLPESYLRLAIQTMTAFGSPDALPVLEALTRSSRPRHIREAATAAYIEIAKSADAAGEVRRLLWDAPDTALEKDVLAQPRAALPRVWNALTGGSAAERRVAAAILGSFPDARSVRPILTAIDQSPGAVTRDQLLFDLNMILLTEGRAATSEQRNAIAATHLRWVYEQVAAGAIDADSRARILRPQVISVYPDRVVSPFSMELSPQVAASVAPSAEAFRATIWKGDAAGVAFHEITVVDDVARVGATLYVSLPNGGVTTPIWIGLYRREGNAWLPMKVPGFHVFRYDGMLNRPNLLPTINRNYGPDEPFKRLRLDLVMERVRMDLGERHLLQHENLLPGSSHPIDRSYVPLLERYKRSDAPSVRYVAELETTMLTGAVNVELWIDTLVLSGTPYQEMAQQMVGSYVMSQITANGRTVTGADRDELIATAINPEAADSRLLPRQALQPGDVRLVRRTERFASIEAVVGIAPLGGSGYTMLFERRGQRWVFLCLAKIWIS